MTVHRHFKALTQLLLALLNAVRHRSVLSLWISGWKVMLNILPVSPSHYNLDEHNCEIYKRPIKNCHPEGCISQRWFQIMWWGAVMMKREQRYNFITRVLWLVLHFFLLSQSYFSSIPLSFLRLLLGTPKVFHNSKILNIFNVCISSS